jgi:penicillin-binding protein 1A
VDAPYVAEMVRNDMQAKYGDGIYTAGYQVFTTIDSRLEAAATVALRTGLLEYDRRHGWRGATDQVDMSKLNGNADMEAELEDRPAVGGLRPAIVESVEDKSAKIYVKDMGSVTLPWPKLSWARRELPDEKVDRSPAQAAEIVHRGDVIYTVGTTPESLQFVQIPQAQSALVAMDPKDGAVVALVGGFDYFQSKFNRVTQARRQPGSGFKPFVYAAAFDKGYTPASVVLDAPIVIDNAGSDQAWRPKEDEGEFYGPVRLREALAHSRNLVSVRLVREIGLDYTRSYVTRFGFDKSQVPDNLTMALGTAELSPLQLVTGYSTFANGGFKVSPYYVDRILDAGGKTLYQAEPLVACPECAPAADQGAEPVGSNGQALSPAAAVIAAAAARSTAPLPATVRPNAARDRASSNPRSALIDEGTHDETLLIPRKDIAPQVLRPQVAYLLSDMMADVIRHGTGMRALVLGRDDIAGKTGTTNDAHDAWFSGFNADLVATVWTGFDQDRSLGELEQGSRAALPTWIFFMHQALAGVPRRKPPVPDGIVTARISPDTGFLAGSDDPNAIMEKFIEGSLPKQAGAAGAEGQNTQLNDGDKPLF